MVHQSLIILLAFRPASSEFLALPRAEFGPETHPPVVAFDVLQTGFVVVVVARRRRRLVGLELVAVLVKQHAFRFVRRIARLGRFLRDADRLDHAPAAELDEHLPRAVGGRHNLRRRPAPHLKARGHELLPERLGELLDVVHGGLAHAVNRVVDLLASVRGLAHVPRQARQRLFAHSEECRRRRLERRRGPREPQRRGGGSDEPIRPAEPPRDHRCARRP